METTEMRERSAVLWSEPEKTSSRGARLVAAAIRDDEYDTARAAATGMSPAGRLHHASNRSIRNAAGEKHSSDGAT
jgi:hypothetical protein